jgi:hypothetical protein
MHSAPHRRFAVMRHNRHQQDLKRQTAREEFDYVREWMQINHGVDINSDFFGEALDEIDCKRTGALVPPKAKARTDRRDIALQALATIAGLAGALLLATKGQHAAWGWWGFLASNVGWIAFAWLRRFPWLLMQQIGFTASSLWGIWHWLVAP